MLIARAFSGFSTWIKLYINSCNFLKNGPLCGLLTFDRSPNMVRRSACRNASFFLYRKDRLWCAAEFKNARTEAGMITRLENIKFYSPNRYQILHHLEDNPYLEVHSRFSCYIIFCKSFCMDVR